MSEIDMIYQKKSNEQMIGSKIEPNSLCTQLTFKKSGCGYVVNLAVFYVNTCTYEQDDIFVAQSLTERKEFVDTLAIEWGD